MERIMNEDKIEVVNCYRQLKMSLAIADVYLVYHVENEDYPIKPGSPLVLSRYNGSAINSIVRWDQVKWQEANCIAGEEFDTGTFICEIKNGYLHILERLDEYER